ncbi:aldehyde dehydrogenase [Sphaeroforma arctica JP610]|uniref:Aldehyde dehydrogenase n=1 Tax=Sphaeroforma arctica JP610 TaxID=667725 RepID=A0A0L0G1S6_9EUKA|nr:aldehyde dehydrogenase [Sphaeroforma arctica JP610]KNC82138.1 aldehyde dehydrogenase [Sphaeroforma arctica JP610]|eukprot:XP_014156040.1 aldehyde dehydrogenase [Sphaeroforma arctica JP610]
MSVFTASAKTAAMAPRMFGTARRNFCAAAALNQKVPSWATVDPWKMGYEAPAEAKSLLNGEWIGAKDSRMIIDPLTGKDMYSVPMTSSEELTPWIESGLACPRSGLHNPHRNVERYNIYGDVNFKIAQAMNEPEVEEYFVKLIQRVTPKSKTQALGEINTARKWLAMYAGDQVRMLARGFSLTGDHLGQETRGFRYPFGNTAVITPFNFPLEIPVLQSLASLFMGNKVLVKVDEKVQIVMEQFIRLAHHCGLPKTDMDMLYSSGPVCGELLQKSDCKQTVFTGSQAVAERLVLDLKGKVRLEDAGFDWKVLGADLPSKKEQEFVAWQCDQDAYAFSGQKCSAQSILFMHENWVNAGLEKQMADRAAMRSLKDFTTVPVLSWSNEKIQKHCDDVLSIPGAKVLFGGKPLEEDHTIPECYGSWQPTAIYVPIDALLEEKNFKIATTELFGPFQIVTHWKKDEEHKVCEALERIQAHLTAAIVSNDIHFINRMLGNTLNGTTYIGLRGRTTGAPQQHWFGPCGDPRGAGIHTPEAIKLNWSGHREVIVDVGPTADTWNAPQPT